MHTDKPTEKLRSGRVTLKMLAAELNLDPATVSVVLNNVPGRSIPEPTRERIRALALKRNYQPSFIARSLRSSRTMTIGVLVPVLSEGYHSEVLNGIYDYLLEEHYFNFIVCHRHRPELIERYPDMLVSRGVEGIIAIDTHLTHELIVPAVSVAGHSHIHGVSNVVLDHNVAAHDALKHLYDLGHRSIAFMRGQPYSADSNVRWESLVNAARELGLPIDPELTVQLTEDVTSPELGYPTAQQLIQKHHSFSAIVCFNDMAAIGVTRALHDAQIRVPQDISVVGFDDLQLAEFNTPRLTTIRQPLHEMGALAARTLLAKLNAGTEMPGQIAVCPKLIVRESTGPARQI